MCLKRFYALAVLIFFISCSDPSSEGARVISLQPYHVIKLNSVFEVYLLQDTSFSVKVMGDARVIENIRFNVREDTLTISNEYSTKWLSPNRNRVSLFIGSSRLKGIEINESCYIKSIDPIISADFQIINQPTPRLCEIDIELDNYYFLYWNNYQCGGSVTLRGKTTHLETHTFALMRVDAKNLIADYAVIENGSKGDCEVNVQQRLRYAIHSTGNIYLYGTPNEISLLEETTSTGKLIQRE